MVILFVVQNQEAGWFCHWGFFKCTATESSSVRKVFSGRTGGKLRVCRWKSVTQRFTERRHRGSQREGTENQDLCVKCLVAELVENSVLLGVALCKKCYMEVFREKSWSYTERGRGDMVQR